MRIIPQCRKPKLHAMHHTPEQLRRTGRNFSCFAPEREHKTSKQRLHQIFRHMETSLIARAANDMLAVLQNADLFRKTHLNDRKQIKLNDPGWPALRHRYLNKTFEQLLCTFSAKSATTARGTFHVGDLLRLRGPVPLGVAAGFYELDCEFCVLLHVLINCGASSWKRTAWASVVHADLKDVHQALTYRECDGELTPFFPKW